MYRLSSLARTSWHATIRSPLLHTRTFTAAIQGPVVGIDLGTTNSRISVMEGNTPHVLENAEGVHATPSVVAFTWEDQPIVGSGALRQAFFNPQGTIHAVKRLIGRKYDDPAIQEQSTPYKIVKANDGDAWVEVGYRKYSPAHISALILANMKSAAENSLGTVIQHAIITVPAYFNDAQRQATKDAGRIAGLNVLSLMDEPAAAALAFGLDKAEDRTVAVYDLGGSTFNFSILKIQNGVIQVKSTHGDTALGGKNFDAQLVEYLVDRFKRDQGIDLSRDPMAIKRIREASEFAKIKLSSTGQTEINLPFITADATGPKHLTLMLTRPMLESFCEGVINRTLEPCMKTIQDAGVNVRDLDDVVLVGGASRIPKVIEIVRNFFSRDPIMSANPEEAVVMGAAIHGSVLAGGSVTDTRSSRL